MLSILGIVAIVVITIQAYKTAASNGRNAPGWAAVTAVIGIGIQFALPIFIGIAIGIYYAATGANVDNIGSEYIGLFTIIGVAGIVLSIVGMYLVMKYVSKVPDDDPSPMAPPPPPTFGNDQ
jgi:putative Mn2+ efflux pump MntP